MISNPLLQDPIRSWSCFEPNEDDPWDLARVAHLHRRAGFCAPWSILQRDLNDGPEASITRLLDGEPVAGDGTKAPEFERLMNAMASRLGASGPLNRLQGAWLYRMIFTPHPLQERLTLFWHDHFATSISKVEDPAQMQRQHELIREHALGDFGRLLIGMGKDPAMLIWLDATTNRKAHPNENYAREVMELFTLGRGRYSERDIQEAARAFTGSFIVQGRYTELAREHDDGLKTVMGQTGPFKADDIARILLDQPACAEFLCRKLFATFLSEVDDPSPELIAPLAEVYRAADYDTKAPVEMILRSRLFHDPSMRRRRVKSPVEFTIGTIRALEVLSPTVPVLELADACSQMGQSLFAPPSVSGWDGGSAWINTTTSLARSNFVLKLIDSNRFDPESLASRHGQDAESFFVDLLVQDAFEEQVRANVRGKAKDVVALVLTAPEYQLG